MKRKSGPGLGLLRALLVGVSVAASAFSVAAAERSPITIDDLLGAESPGQVWFSPDGKYVAYAHQGSIASQDSWGYDFADLARSRVFVAPRENGQAREIPGTEEVRYGLLSYESWAPDSDGLLLLASRPEGYGLAHWDADTGRLYGLPGRPASLFTVHDWLPDGRIVYAVLAEGGRQRGAHAQVLQTLNEKWGTHWKGDAPQVTVSSADPVFASTAVAPGALLLADPKTRTTTKLATGDYLAVAVSPDGRRIAAVCAKEQVPEAYNIVSGRRGELQLFALSAKGATLLHRYADIDVAWHNALAWSPAGDRLLVGGKPAQEHRDATRLYDIDVTSGKRREIAPAGLSFINPGAGELGSLLPLGWAGGRPIAVVAREGVAAQPAQNVRASTARLEYGETRDLRFDVFLFEDGQPRNLSGFAKTSVNRFVIRGDAGAVLAVADGKLWELAEGADPHALTPEEVRIVAFGVDRQYPEPAAGTAYYRSGTVERIGLYVANDKGAPKRRVLDLRAGTLTELQPRGEIVATAPDQMGTVSTSVDGWTARLTLDGTGGRELAAFNGDLQSRAVAPVRRFEYQHGGKALTGWLVLPPDGADRNLPAVVSVYGGAVYGAEAPAYTRTDFNLPVFSGQLLAAHGYAVIYPSTPLGPGSSTDLMTTLADQAIAAVDALAAQGVVDPKRVGVTGQSFGGFSTAAILARHSDRFRAGVAMAGVYDWIYGYGVRALEHTFSDGGVVAPETTMVEIGQIRLAEPFWRTPEAYMRNSPIFSVDKIDAPLLMLQGDLDLGVTGLPGAERMYSALLRAGKKPALVRYWGEGHVAQSESAIRDQWSRITGWFDAHLRPESTPHR